MGREPDALSPKSAEQMLYDYGLEATLDIFLVQAAQGHAPPLLLRTLPRSWKDPFFLYRGTTFKLWDLCQALFWEKSSRRWKSGG